MRPVDPKCRVPSEPKHSTMMLRHRGIVRVAARGYQRREASRRNGASTRAIQASLRPAGVAHQAAREQLGELVVERARQGVDQRRVA